MDRRTDCQNGSPGDSYESLINRLELPDGTVVYPGHGDEADSVGSIGQKRAFKLIFNGEYTDIMNNLALPNPKMFDVAIPENLNVGIKNFARGREQNIIGQRGPELNARGRC